MLLLFWLLLLLVGACLILLMPALWGKQIYNSYHDPRAVNCPETHAQVSVRFDALRAAITGLTGKPKLRLADCSRWPVHADCRPGMHSGRCAKHACASPSNRPAADQDDLPRARSDCRRRCLGARYGLAFRVSVPATMDECPGPERPPDAGTGRDVDASPSDRRCLPSLRLWRRLGHELVGFSLAVPRPPGGAGALDGDDRRLTGDDALHWFLRICSGSRVCTPCLPLC